MYIFYIPEAKPFIYFDVWLSLESLLKEFCLMYSPVYRISDAYGREWVIILKRNSPTPRPCIGSILYWPCAAIKVLYLKLNYPVRSLKYNRLLKQSSNTDFSISSTQLQKIQREFSIISQKRGENSKWKQLLEEEEVFGKGSIE